MEEVLWSYTTCSIFVLLAVLEYFEQSAPCFTEMKCLGKLDVEMPIVWVGPSLVTSTG
jgi:hypothetical protein